MKTESIYAGNSKPAKIIRCSFSEGWWKDNVGETIKIRELNWPSAYVEASNGFTILKSDLDYEGNPKA